MPRNARIAPLALESFALFYGASRVRRPSPDELPPADAQRVLDQSVTRVKKGGPNQLHMRRLSFAAEPFAEAGQADLNVVSARARTPGLPPPRRGYSLTSTCST